MQTRVAHRTAIRELNQGSNLPKTNNSLGRRPKAQAPMYSGYSSDIEAPSEVSNAFNAAGY